MPKIVNGTATTDSITLVFSGRVGKSGMPTITRADGTSLKPRTVQTAGKSIILYPETPPKSHEWLLVTSTLDDGSSQTVPIQVDSGSDNSQRDADEITAAVEDAVSYPILTEPVSFPLPSSGTGTASYYSSQNGGGVTATAAQAITDILGWKANEDDPKGFIGALTQSFDLTDVEGHVEAKWNPRTYAVQTDMGGGITGAQASLFTRAKSAIDSLMPLLNGLYPLDPDADPEYVKALREMARSQISEIVKEFGTVGGPSVLRINTYFGILLGQADDVLATPADIEYDPDSIGGTLGTLRETYGIGFANNPFSNTIEDEQDITNFRIIADHLTSLRQSWISNAQFFLLGQRGPAFFGTQLVLLSRQFSVIGESVNQVRFAMDSVFIGPSERQTLLLEFNERDHLPAIFIEQLLVEIEEFSREEGPRLLQDGGRISVTNNILPVMRAYSRMIRHARHPRNIHSLPDGYRTTRVRRTLDDLHDQLRELARLSESVTQVVPPPLEKPEFFVVAIDPDVVQIDPSAGQENPQTVRAFITGGGFSQGDTVSLTLNPPSTAPSALKVDIKVYSENLISAKISNLSGEAGTYDLSVITKSNQTATLLSAFHLIDDTGSASAVQVASLIDPTFLSFAIDPKVARVSDGSIRAYITGGGFGNDSTVSLTSVTTSPQAPSTKLLVELSKVHSGEVVEVKVTGLTPGTYDLKIMSSGKTITVPSAFHVIDDSKPPVADPAPATQDNENVKPVDKGTVSGKSK